MTNPPASYSGGRAFVTQLTKFAGVGAIGIVVQYLLLITAVEFYGAPAVTISIVGFVLGALINYVLNYRYTFQSRRKHSETATKFFFIAAIGVGINGALMLVAVQQLGLHYLASQIFGTAIVFFWNFIANRYWTFRN